MRYEESTGYLNDSGFGVYGSAVQQRTAEQLLQEYNGRKHEMPMSFSIDPERQGKDKKVLDVSGAVTGEISIQEDGAVSIKIEIDGKRLWVKRTNWNRGNCCVPYVDTPDLELACSQILYAIEQAIVRDAEKKAWKKRRKRSVSRKAENRSDLAYYK